VFDREIAHAFERRVGVDVPCGVRRGVNDEQGRIVSDYFGEVVQRGLEREVVWSEIDSTERAPSQFRHRLVGDPRRVQKHHLVPVVDERLEEFVECLLAAGGH